MTAASTPSFSQVQDTFLIDPPLWFEHLCAAYMSESLAVLSVVNRLVFQNIPGACHTSRYQIGKENKGGLLHPDEQESVAPRFKRQ